jgi:hypothetical protein
MDNKNFNNQVHYVNSVLHLCEISYHLHTGGGALPISAPTPTATHSVSGHSYPTGNLVFLCLHPLFFLDPVTSPLATRAPVQLQRIIQDHQPSARTRKQTFHVI